MRARTKAIGALVIVLLVAAAAGVVYWRYWTGDPAASQHGLVEQQIAGTILTVDYNRPVARGREPFGDIVAWGQMWNPGDDRQAVLRVSTDVQINGQPLPSGRYSIWAQPQMDAWTVVFSKALESGVPVYRDGQDALRLTVTPRNGPHMETLAFYLPVVDGRAAELVLHWGRIVVPFQVTVP